MEEEEEAPFQSLQKPSMFNITKYFEEISQKRNGTENFKKWEEEWNKVHSDIQRTPSRNSYYRDLVQQLVHLVQYVFIGAISYNACLIHMDFLLKIQSRGS
jgi:hypothetical protein